MWARRRRARGFSRHLACGRIAVRGRAAHYSDERIEPDVEVIPSRSLPDHRGPSTEHPNMTGPISRKGLVSQAPSGSRAVIIWFPSGSETAWHSHEGGQVLHVLSGEGFVETENGHRVVITTGDTVLADPGERHRHGAGALELTQLTCSYGSTDWSA